MGGSTNDFTGKIPETQGLIGVFSWLFLQISLIIPAIARQDDAISYKDWVKMSSNKIVVNNNVIIVMIIVMSRDQRQFVMKKGQKGKVSPQNRSLLCYCCSGFLVESKAFDAEQMRR